MKIEIFKRDIKNALASKDKPVETGEIVEYVSYKRDYTSATEFQAIIRTSTGALEVHPLANLRAVKTTVIKK